MKKSIIYTVLTLGILTSSCNTDDFLTLEPSNSNTALSFFNTEKQINEGVTAIYTSHRGIYSNQWKFGEFRSDNTSYQRNEADRGGARLEENDEFTMSADNGNISQLWNGWYGVVLDANNIINNIPEVDFNDSALKDARLGEALFFRTWAYFNLTRNFGAVPFVTSVASSPENAVNDEFTTRVDKAEIHAAIMEDLERAISFLPKSWSPSDEGRVTQGTALMLKAKILMEDQQFSEAIAPLRQMETLGYQILADYKQNFDPSNKNSAESVFELQYSFDQGQPSNFLTSFVPFNSGSDLVIFGTASGRAGLNQPTQDLINLYSEEDARFSVNIAFYGEGDASEPYINKYYYLPLAPGQQDINYPVFRYADARLMLAECLVETGDITSGLNIVNNEIRPRTGLTETVDATSKEEALEKIAIERRLELAFENHRWFDLVRTGKAVETMKAHGDDLLALKPHLTQGLEYENIRTLLAIPFNQVQQFGYEQNAGW
ncbi:RagB/SusD family nutrient uptake outer membrane protein [Galbibacter mesophilus]|uniref:RagB/SusD family nutrient uptake outer membrane protein n=1 Tax=Galbibacter mesophilus TaxID=379069 RepID=UPI00191E3FCC|nr:RagB/SusD family nutrient uptake outer membrane protein [Galbibacter mesophilus]MCM5663865.1 RagB/SusD family nutrient uptake outer membrane protein [Galbibacter mesophilus]